MSQDQDCSYESDSDYSYKSSSSSSSGSETDSSVSVDDLGLNTSSQHLLSPPPSAPVTEDAPLRHRPRSASFNVNVNIIGTNSTGTPVSRQGGSTPRSRNNSVVSLDTSENGGTSIISGSYHDFANRPRSNPRNRTPMRNTTPVLGPVNRATIANDDMFDLRSSSNTSNPRSGSNPRHDSHGRASASANTTSPSPSSISTSTSINNTAQIVGLGANLTVGTVLRSSTLSALHEHQPSHRAIHNHNQLSSKQGPGHRKVRRWNNDKFIGIASDISHANPQRGMKIANIYAEAEMDKGRYLMPNYPRDNRTIFSTLCGANDNGNGNGNGSEDAHSSQVRLNLDPKEVMKIRERFVDGEVGVGGQDQGMTQGAKDRMKRRQDLLFKDGHRMMKSNVNERLMNVVVRSCKSSGFTRNVVDAFERLLVNNMSDADNCNSNGKISSSHNSDPDGDIWNKVVVQNPFITRKEKIGVMIRMLFNEGERKGAFNRLLLHAVCQFHGLDTCSTTTSKGYRMLTITGRCQGSTFRFLEFVPFDVNSSGPLERDVGNTGGLKDETAATQLMLDNMAVLRVQ